MNFFQKLKFHREIKNHQSRPLNINEILSRDTETNVVIDAYEYFMRQSNWEIDGRFNSTVNNFLLCVLYDGEIGNGGISQFFINNSGNYAHQIADALHIIGAIGAEKLLRKSFEFFPNGTVPTNKDIRSEFLNQLNDTALDQLDIDAYNEDIYSFCYQYLMDNKSEFF